MVSSSRMRIGIGWTVALLLAFGAWAQRPAELEFARAMELAASGRFAEAEEVLRFLEQAHPNQFELRYRLGVILLRQGKNAEALERLEAATKLAPESPLPHLALAQVQLRLKQREQSMASASRAAERSASQPAVWRALAMFYTESGQYALAAEFEERWGKAAPQDTESRLRLAQLHRQLAGEHRKAKLPAEAAKAYQTAIRLVPEQPAAYYELATMLLDHRMPEPAIAILKSAAARFPKEAEFHRLLGLSFYHSGQVSDAIGAFLRVIDLEPGSEVGYASLETLLGDAGPQLGVIISRLRDFRERQPQTPVGHFLLAKALAVQGSPAPEVEGLLRQAIGVEPRFWPAKYELGLLLESKEQQDEAVELLTEASELNPEYAPAHFALARVHGRSGDRQRAIHHRRKHAELTEQQRKATEAARAEFPALPYRIEAGSAESERKER